jgi:hypothetical protein
MSPSARHVRAFLLRRPQRFFACRICSRRTTSAGRSARFATQVIALTAAVPDRLGFRPD